MKKNVKKPLTCVSVLAFALCLLCAVAGCKGRGGADGSKTEVRIAYFPNITHTQALVLKNRKTPETVWADKCEVSWTSFNAGPAEIEAVFAGEIDLGYIGPVPAINANVKSEGDVKIIANATNAGAVLLVREGAGIASVSDLSGKKVAVPQIGNTQHLCLLSLLRENGLQTVDKGGDVTVSASSNADIVNLMDNGSIDAALVPEPWGTIIEKNGSAKVLLDYDEIFLGGDYPTAVVIANGSFLEQHPDLVREFLEMHDDVALYIRENPKEAQKAVNSEIESVTGKPVDGDVLEAAFSRIEVDSQLNTKAILSFAKISSEEGFISKVPEESDVFKTQFDQ